MVELYNWPLGPLRSEARGRYRSGLLSRGVVRGLRLLAAWPRRRSSRLGAALLLVECAVWGGSVVKNPWREFFLVDFEVCAQGRFRVGERECSRIFSGLRFGPKNRVWGLPIFRRCFSERRCRFKRAVDFGVHFKGVFEVRADATTILTFGVADASFCGIGLAGNAEFGTEKREFHYVFAFLCFVSLRTSF